MNTLQLRRNLRGNVIFRGVFPRDIFINTPLREGIHIVNTDPSYQPGAHWFLVEKIGQSAIIFDSYGTLSPVATDSPGLLRHINRYCRHIRMNATPLQSIDSNVCGNYCLLYAAARGNGYSAHEILSRLLSIRSAHMRDHAVRHFILENFSNTLPSTGYGYERVHVHL